MAKPFTLDNTQRQILQAEVYARAYRRGDGKYQLLGGVYDSLEEAEHWALQRCITERTVPISMFHSFDQAQVRELEEAKRKSALIERAMSMSRRLTWKED